MIISLILNSEERNVTRIHCIPEMIAYLAETDGPGGAIQTFIFNDIELFKVSCIYKIKMPKFLLPY